MIEELRKQEIIEKFEKKEFDLTDEQIYILQENHDLIEKFVSIMDTSFNYLITNNLDTSNFNNLINIIISEGIQWENISEDILVNFMFKEIDDDVINYNEIESIFSELDFNEENKKRVLDYYYNSLRNNNYKNVEKIYIGDTKTLELLLDFKRYDLLSKIIIADDLLLSTDLKQRLINELKNNKIRENVYNDIYENEYDVLSFDSLIKSINDSVINENNYDELLVALDKVLNEENANRVDLSLNYDFLFSKLPPGYKDRIINKLKNSIKNGAKILPEFYWYTRLYIEPVIEELIETGNLNIALYSSNFSG